MAAMQHAARHISRLNFAANLSFLFPEIPDFKQRYAAAKEAGFGGVECGAEIYAIPISELVSVKENSDIIQVLLNSFTGDNYGIAAVPSRADEFKQCLELSIQYCNALKCKRMHIMAGQYPEGLNVTKEISRSYEETYLNNLKFASQRLELENIKLLIEPISTIPNYFLTRTDQALQILKALNCKNVFLQLDVYHHQRTHGNIADTISENIDFIGHIQIGQVPGRHEPDRSGEVNFQFVFNHLLKLGYTGWIGCEYLPSGNDELGMLIGESISDEKLARKDDGDVKSTLTLKLKALTVSGEKCLLQMSISCLICAFWMNKVRKQI